MAARTNQSPIKSTARKLPIKRNPNPQTTPPNNPLVLLPTQQIYNPEPLNSTSFSLESNNDDATTESQSQDPPPLPPPFKFHRIWSEPDEIRFLQGLLGCASQNLVFPRDLNIFYDRFSDSMPQPFTRTQLSEKLRRLRKKFKIMSGRIEKGQDPNRLALHDKDLLHLCRRLWDPNCNSSSPFNSIESVVGADIDGASMENKRRRLVNPKVPEKNEENVGRVTNEIKIEACQVEEAKDMNVANVANEDASDVRGVAIKCVLDAFDESVSEFGESLGIGAGGSEMERRWREQRVAELDVFARSLRLVLEKKFSN